MPEEIVTMTPLVSTSGEELKSESTIKAEQDAEALAQAKKLAEDKEAYEAWQAELEAVRSKTPEDLLDTVTRIKSLVEVLQMTTPYVQTELQNVQGQRQPVPCKSFPVSTLQMNKMQSVEAMALARIAELLRQI